MAETTDSGEAQRREAPRQDSLPPPSIVTIPWLLRHVPVGLWATAIALLVGSFTAGITASKLTFIQDLFQSTRVTTMPNLSGTWRVTSSAGPGTGSITDREESLTFVNENKESASGDKKGSNGQAWEIYATDWKLKGVVNR